MANTYMYGGVHPSLMGRARLQGYERGPGLAGPNEAIPGVDVGIRGGSVSLDAPVVPALGAVGGALLGSKWGGGMGAAIGGVAGYFLLRLAVIGVRGQNISTNL